MNKQAMKGKGHRPQSTSNNKGDGKKKDDDSSFVYNLGILIGCSAEIHTKSGERYEGIFSAFSQSSYEIMIEAAHLKESNVDDDTTAINEHYDLLIVPSDKILFIKFPSAEVSYACRDFQTDAAIGAKRGVGMGDKELTPWSPDDTGEPVDHLDLDSGPSNGWEAQDMFKKNEEKYGIRSSFKQDLSGYTTQLDKSDPNLRKHEEQAAQIAQAIENNTSSQERAQLENGGGDEEEAFSAVVRTSSSSSSTTNPPPQTNATTSANQPPSSNTSGDKYVPPSRRPSYQQQANVQQTAQSHPVNNSSSPPINNNNNSNNGKPSFGGGGGGPNSSRYPNSTYKTNNPNYAPRYSEARGPRHQHVNMNSQRGDGRQDSRQDGRPHLEGNSHQDGRRPQDDRRVPNKAPMFNRGRENQGGDHIPHLQQQQGHPHQQQNNQQQQTQHQQQQQQQSNQHQQSNMHPQPQRNPHPSQRGLQHFKENFHLVEDNSRRGPGPRSHPGPPVQQGNNNASSGGIRNPSPPTNNNNNNNNPPPPSPITSTAPNSSQSPVKPKKEEALLTSLPPPSLVSANTENSNSSDSPSNNNPSPPNNNANSSASPSPPSTTSTPSEAGGAVKVATTLGSKPESQSTVVVTNNSNDSKGNVDSDSKSKKTPFAFNPNAKEFNPTAKAFTPQRSPSTPPRPPSTPASAPQLIQPVNSFMSLPMAHPAPLIYATPSQYQAALTTSTNPTSANSVGTPRHTHRKPMMNVPSRSDINISQPMQMAAGPQLLAPVQTAAPSGQAIYFQTPNGTFQPQMLRILPQGMMPQYQNPEGSGGAGQMHQPMHFLHNGTASQNNPGHQSNNTPQTNPNAPQSVVQANGHAYQGAGYPQGYVTFTNQVPAMGQIIYAGHGSHPPPHQMILPTYVSHQGGGNN